MASDSSDPLDGVDPGSVAPGDVDEAAVRAALSSPRPLVRQRGVEICQRLAGDDVDAVRPFLDEVASLAGDDYAPVALRAIALLDAVAGSEPAALDGRLSALVGALGSDVVDVQLTGATLLGELVLERPDLLAPYPKQLIEALRATEPAPAVEDFGDVVADPVTRRTLQEHEEAERSRRVSARRTLVNVLVAVTEEEPESAFDAVDDFVALLSDVDPAVAGGAVDALGELAAVDPAVVAPARDPLIDCLDHERTFVRARAVRALGRLGDDGAVPRLRALAEEDDDEDLREMAAVTADYLAGTS